PWLMRFPDGLGALNRSQALVQPADLPSTLLDWWGLDWQGISAATSSLLAVIRGELRSVRDRACVRNQLGETGIRTERCYLRQSSQPDVLGDEPRNAAGLGEVGQSRWLYAKPDDRFEVNELSARCHEIGDSLVQAYRDYLAGCQQGTLEGLPPLDPAVQA